MSIDMSIGYRARDKTGSGKGGIWFRLGMRRAQVRNE